MHWISFRLAIALGSMALVAGSAYYWLQISPIWAAEARFARRIAEVKKQANGFDQNEALRRLVRSDDNGFTFRFDDQLEQAVATPKSVPALPDLVRMEFEHGEPVSLTTATNAVTIDGGVLHVDYQRSEPLTTDIPLGLARDQVGGFEIRIWQEQGNYFEVSWITDDPDQERGSMRVHTRGRREFHDYKIDVEKILRRSVRDGEVIQQLRILPSGVLDDVVHIQSVRVIASKAKYSQPPRGRAYESLAGEVRQVLYAMPPTHLRYQVDLPLRPVTLSFGTGIQEPDAAIIFRVELESAERSGEPVTLYREKHGSLGWRDSSIDLSRWAGESVVLSFQVSGASDRVAFWSNPLLESRPAKPLSFLIVLEDTLRAENLSGYGYARDTSPNRDRLAARGVRFLRAYSQAGETRPSVATMMTGLYPTAAGVWDHNEKLHDSYLTLAEILRSQGFATANFTQNDNTGRFGGLHQGFSVVFDGATTKTSPKVVLDMALGWSRENSQRNRFLYIHLIDPHAPYAPPPSYRDWHKENRGGTSVRRNAMWDPAWVRRPTFESRLNLYDGEIRRNDDELGEFFAQLEEEGLLEDTVVVMTGDHGEFIGEHGLMGHIPPTFTQGVRVPLIWIDPHMPLRAQSGTTVSQPVGLIDLMPTLLERAGISLEGLPLSGDSLLPLMAKGTEGSDDFWDARLTVAEEVVQRTRGQAQPAWGSVFHRERHLIRSNQFVKPGGASRVRALRIYDTANDASEEMPLPRFFSEWFLARSGVRVLQNLHAHNLAIWQQVTHRRQRAIEYDPEAVERLRALGYLEE